MMDAAVSEALSTGATTNPILAGIFFAESVNRRNGGTLVRPWELEAMPDDYALAYRSILEVTSKERQRNQEKARLEGLFEDARRKHPSYRKV